MRNILLATAAVGALALAAPAAHANPVTVWAGTGVGFTPFPLTNTGNGSANVSANIGAIFSVQASATGSVSPSGGLPQPSFDTSTIDITAIGGGTLFVWGRNRY